MSVFYDSYHMIEMWGKDLYSHLDRVYREDSRYCVLFLSEDYATKVWTNHERRSAQARAFREHEDYILPARFDDTQIDGIRETTGYLDLSDRTPEELADAIIMKVGPSGSPRFSELLAGYFEELGRTLESPYYTRSAAVELVEQLALDTADEFMLDSGASPDIDSLPLEAAVALAMHGQITLEDLARASDRFQEWNGRVVDSEGRHLHTRASVDHWESLAHVLFQRFKRMTPDERLVVGTILAYGCRGELPTLVHIDPIELQRLTGMNDDETTRHLTAARHLGFTARQRPPVHVEPGEIISVDAYDLTLTFWSTEFAAAIDSLVGARALLAASVVGCCYEHGLERLRRCDFSAA